MLGTVRQQFERLRSKSEILHTNVDPTRDSALLDLFVKIIARTLDAERCSIFIHDPVKEKVWLKSGTGVGEREIEVPLATSVVGQVISSGRHMTQEGMDKSEGMHKQVDSETGFVTRNVLCVPIQSRNRGEVTGAIQVLNKKNGANFTDDDVALLREIGDFLQLQIDRVFLNQEVFGAVKGLFDLAGKLMMTLFGLGSLAFIAMLVIFSLVAVGHRLG
jgi:signal transduction protein with GAF and PtsI domain